MFLCLNLLMEMFGGRYFKKRSLSARPELLYIMELTSEVFGCIHKRFNEAMLQRRFYGINRPPPLRKPISSSTKRSAGIFQASDILPVSLNYHQCPLR